MIREKLVSALRKSNPLTLQEWADAAGYKSVSGLARAWKKATYGRSTPGQFMRHAKYSGVVGYLFDHPFAGGAEIAGAVGFDSRDSLYSFLKTNYNTTLGQLRIEAARIKARTNSD